MEAQNQSTPPALVLYDGLCGFCDGAVQWLLSRDKAGNLTYAPLQGETAAAVRARHPELPDQLDSIIFVEQDGAHERVYWYSRAAFRIATYLPSPWRALRLLGLIPRFLTDLGYRIVAKARYRIWGRLDACRLPSPEERARFLP